MSAQHCASFWVFFIPLFEPLKPHNHSNTAIVSTSPSTSEFAFHNS